MGPLDWILGSIIIVLAIAVSVVVLMQETKEGGLSGAISGGSNSFLGGSKGMSKDKLLSKITTVLAIAFAVLVVATYFLVQVF